MDTGSWFNHIQFSFVLYDGYTIRNGYLNNLVIEMAFFYHYLVLGYLNNLVIEMAFLVQVTNLLLTCSQHPLV
jgi:hypothetical protein